MRRARLTGQAAVNQAVVDLLDKFDYPDELGSGSPSLGGGGGGMAHFLIVAESEPQQIQEKADYTVPASDSAAPLQEVFDEIDDLMNGGAFSIWLAGSFELDDDVTAPSGAWIRGLGYVGGGET